MEKEGHIDIPVCLTVHWNADEDGDPRRSRVSLPVYTKPAECPVLRVNETRLFAYWECLYSGLDFQLLNILIENAVQLAILKAVNNIVFYLFITDCPGIRFIGQLDNVVS